jgi:transglutaminase-like putative cysteine protease
MDVRVGCEFVYESTYPTPMVFLIRPRDHDLHHLVEESWEVRPDLPVHTYVDGFGNHAWRLTAPAGAFRLRYDAIAAVDPAPDPVLVNLPGTPVSELPDDVLAYTLPSRYCQSDLFADDAWALFGTAPDGWSRVQAICDWVHANITYGAGSVSTTSSYEAYQQRRGVCRDFAHIAVSFCRALNIPARYVCGYLPDIGVPFNPIPMDFHAWFEAYLGGAWRTFDARHNQPRIGRVVIARGRDAVDTALTTIYGAARLVSMQVWADEVNQLTPAQPFQSTEVSS